MPFKVVSFKHVKLGYYIQGNKSSGLILAYDRQVVKIDIGSPYKKHAMYHIFRRGTNICFILSYQKHGEL